MSNRDDIRMQEEATQPTLRRKYDEWQPVYTVTVTTYKDSQVAGNRTVTRDVDRSRADSVAASYVADYVMQGGTATYSDGLTGFRIAMRDGSKIYVKVWG